MLFDRLRLDYVVDKPDVDETPLPGERPAALCLRLARIKAEAVAPRHAGRIVVGSDQLVAVDGQVLGKPGNFDTARQQLRLMSGRKARFHVAVHVIDRAGIGRDWHEIVTAQLRTLSDDEIRAYLDLEQPYDSAGSMRAEGLGITLLDALESQDPTAIIGLPLIATSRLLREAGAPSYSS